VNLIFSIKVKLGLLIQNKMSLLFPVASTYSLAVNEQGSPEETLSPLSFFALNELTGLLHVKKCGISHPLLELIVEQTWIISTTRSARARISTALRNANTCQ
jgi:hypothetical protein